MIKIAPGSHAYRIIVLILMIGEFPFQSLELLGDARTLKAIATRLSKVDTVKFSWHDKPFEGRVICISGKSEMKTMRLSKSKRVQITGVIFIPYTKNAMNTTLVSIINET